MLLSNQMNVCKQVHMNRCMYILISLRTNYYSSGDLIECSFGPKQILVSTQKYGASPTFQKWYLSHKKNQFWKKYICYLDAFKYGSILVCLGMCACVWVCATNWMAARRIRKESHLDTYRMIDWPGNVGQKISWFFVAINFNSVENHAMFLLSWRERVIFKL